MDVYRDQSLDIESLGKGKTMKEIKAIIRPFKLLEVTEELEKIDGLPGVTVSEIKVLGKNKARDADDKMIDGMVEFIPRIKLEIVVPDEMVDEVVDVIQKYSHTGNPGDGKIFVLDVVETITIRTNERRKNTV
jgi:nitrogen regulatory protein P-II 1